jgi:aminopeptidase N
VRELANGLGLDHESQGNYFIFEECPPISTYIYAVAAGPYHVFTSKSGFNVPMRVICRQSKAELADAESKFQLIEHALTFFEGFFSCSFPFKKYD